MLLFHKVKCLKRFKKLSKEYLRLKGLVKMQLRLKSIQSLRRLRLQRLKELERLPKKRRNVRNAKKKELKEVKLKRRRLRLRGQSQQLRESLQRSQGSATLTAISSQLYLKYGKSSATHTKGK
jgi:hypothetical protein